MPRSAYCVTSTKCIPVNRHIDYFIDQFETDHNCKLDVVEKRILKLEGAERDMLIMHYSDTIVRLSYYEACSIATLQCTNALVSKWLGVIKAQGLRLDRLTVIDFKGKEIACE